MKLFSYLNLGLHIFDGIGGLDFESDGFAGQRFDEDLHTTTKSEDQMEGGLFLDVVIREGSAILELLTGEDKSLLVWGNTLFVLDFRLDVFDGVGGLDLKGDGLSGEGLDENLHSSSQSEHKVEGGLFLDVIVRKGAAVLQLFSGENETLLVWGNSLLVLKT